MAAGERESREYMERHGLPALLHRLTALLLYHRPERPRQFVLRALEAERRGAAERPRLLDEAGMDAAFRMMDAAGRGFVTAAQCRAALEALGLNPAELHVGDEEEVTLAEFKEVV
ncbi:EFC10 protein, partial [Odontophorus gujanensis]|nr:EFC10 protein [Odontophorus gujanensis]